jgi:hypothetical protein
MVKDEPLNEITLRRYEKPYQADKRELVKKVCLSLGLLQPGDSRDIIIDILSVLLDARKNKEKLSSDDIKLRVENSRKEKNLELKGVAESNIRRQLKKLRDLMIIDKKENLYNLAEFESLSSIFESKIEKFLIGQATERIKEYLKAVEQ